MKNQDNMANQPATPEAFSARISAHYTADAAFRTAFDKNPKEALSKVLGWEVPSDVKIEVHRNKDKCFHITLPSADAVTELSDEDAANVSGGFFNAFRSGDIWEIPPHPEFSPEQKKRLNYLAMRHHAGYMHPDGNLSREEFSEMLSMTGGMPI